MGYFTISVAAPHATAYDEDYPTRSTENYSHALHEILQDMEDNTFYVIDEVVWTTDRNTIRALVNDMIEAVFDYAEGAIDTYRSTGTPTLAKPVDADIDIPTLATYPMAATFQWQVHAECRKMQWFIYYMWKTEEDPLLLKEKLQELLIAWPLLDTTIQLSSELGQEFKVYPSWKNADLSP